MTTASVSDPVCSFCGISMRQLNGSTMIAGPSVYICAGCVELCADIILERRDGGGPLKDIGRSTDRLAQLTRDLEGSRRRTRELELAIRSVIRAIATVTPPKAITCMWCDELLDSNEHARGHVATCEKHPAVIALREATASKDQP